MYYEFMISIGEGISGNAEFHYPFVALRTAGINVVSAASAFTPHSLSRIQNIGIVVGDEQDPEVVADALASAYDGEIEFEPEVDWKKVRTAVLKDEAGSLALFLNHLNDNLVTYKGYAGAYEGLDSFYILKTDDEGIHIGYTLTGDGQGDDSEFKITEG